MSNIVCASCKGRGWIKVCHPIVDKKLIEVDYASCGKCHRKGKVDSTGGRLPNYYGEMGQPGNYCKSLAFQ